MEINEITQERLAEKFKSALKREGLLYKDVAPKFYTTASTLRDMMSGRAPMELQEWSIVRDWDISGKSLRDYEVPFDKDGEGGSVMAIKWITSFKAIDKPAFTTQSAEPIVKKATVRKEAKKHKKEMAEVISQAITTEDGKTTIDVAELNQKTGTRITVDILEGGYIITVTNLPK